jgi:hypothetical protein
MPDFLSSNCASPGCPTIWPEILLRFGTPILRVAMGPDDCADARRTQADRFLAERVDNA